MFEAWKASADVAPILAREFVLVHVDVVTTPGGQELRQRYPRAQSAGVPWFVIHAADGKELADSIGPDGNIGCPYTDPEIAAFLAILRKVCTSLKDEDYARLEKSLVALRAKKN